MIENVLGYGIENAKDVRILKTLMGYADVRSVYTALASAKKRGVPVCSDGRHGMFIAVNTKEIDDYLRFSNSKAYTVLRNNENLRKKMIAMLRKEEFDGKSIYDSESNNSESNK